MATYSIVFSPTGGTRKVADILCGALDENFITIDILKEVDKRFSAEDLCVISIPSFGGRVPGVCVERMAALKGNGAKAVLVSVFGNRAIGDALLEMKDLALASGFVPVAGMEAVAEHSLARRVATGRPDAEDAAELQAFAEKILQAPAAADLSVPGNRPYKEFGGLPLKPVANETCGGCGQCVEACPAGAIPVEDPRSVKEELCISCMRCVSVCPKGARSVDPAAGEAIRNKLEGSCAERKGNVLYL